jgi:hypothetical protein
VCADRDGVGQQQRRDRESEKDFATSHAQRVGAGPLSVCSDDGVDLYGLVCEYAGLGDHRTGTPTEAATLEWFADTCHRAGATTRLQPWEFPRYDAAWQVRANEVEVPSIPLFYSGIGDVQATGVPLQRVDATGLTPVGSPAADGHAAVALATDGRCGRLVAFNRAPGPSAGVPTICVAGSVDSQQVDVDISARIVPGRSGNVIASLGAGKRRLLVSTPLSGWFACAGERGTGIAVALQVCRQLADEGVAVTLVGTSGHELEGIGVKHFLAHESSAADAVLHIGASVAVHRPAGGADRLYARSSVAMSAFDELDCDYTQVTDASAPASWFGEATQWCRTGLPLLSVAGTFPLFHTPDDLPEAATSPQLLTAMSAHVLDGARALLEAR